MPYYVKDERTECEWLTFHAELLERLLELNVHAGEPIEEYVIEEAIPIAKMISFETDLRKVIQEENEFSNSPDWDGWGGTKWDDTMIDLCKAVMLYARSADEDDPQLAILEREIRSLQGNLWVYVFEAQNTPHDRN